MWLLDQVARFNAQITLMVLVLFKPLISSNPDILHAWEVKQLVCMEIIRNGHPYFRYRRK